MAYADYQFYTDTWLGDTLTEESAPKWLQRASDFLDVATFYRTRDTFPDAEAEALQVQKACCALAEALYDIDVQRRALTASVDSDGNVRAAIASVTAGRESISYLTGAASSAAARAVTDGDYRREYLRGIAAEYIANTPDSEGVNLLYAGVDGFVP